MKLYFCIFNNEIVCVSQLARIQTDSVADRLKELYPDVHLEIGEDILPAINCMNYLYINCIAFLVSFNQMHRFLSVRVVHTHTHTRFLVFMHSLLVCEQRAIVFCWECVIYTTASLLNPTVCVKRHEWWCQNRSQCTTIQPLTFLSVCFSVAMSTIGDKILDTALSKVEFHPQFHVPLCQVLVGRNALELLCAAQYVKIHYPLSNVSDLSCFKPVFSQIGEKSLFTKELENALERNE